MIAAVRRKRGRTIAALVALLLAPACGGSPNTPDGPVLGDPGNPGPPPLRLVGVKVTVTIPSAGSSGLRPDYLSYNTESLSIQLVSVDGNGVTGVNPTILNTLPKSQDCKGANVSSKSGGLTCVKTAKGSPGKDVFAVTTYAGPGATGAVLSVGTVSATIGSGGGNVGISNQVPITLSGIIASLKLALSPNKAKRGTKTTAAVTLDAYDASGAEIVGPSDYEEPISLSIQGDTSHSFSLHASGHSGESLSIAKPTSGITLAYDGNAQASPITVQATVSGPSSISASASFALTGKQPPPPVGTIYALNLGSSSGAGATVTEYDGKAKGNAAPERTLNLSSKLYAVSIAVDSSGDLYVGYFDNNLGFTAGGTPDPGNEIAIYAPNASGNDQPKATITEDTSTGTTIFPIFMAIDPKGGLVTYGATTYGTATENFVLTYAAGASGPAKPEYAFNFSSPAIRYSGPNGLAVDSADDVYLNGSFKSGFNNAYGMYVNSAANIDKAGATPSRVIPWNGKSGSGLSPGSTSNVALNKSGEIFIGNFVTSGSGSGKSCQAAANVYSAGAGGGSKGDSPLRTLTLDGIRTVGKDCTNTFDPRLFFYPTIALYGTSLFAADDYNNAIDAFAASDQGTVKPFLRITGAATQLDAPIALVLTSSVSGQAKAGPVTGAQAPDQVPFKHHNAQ